MRDNIRIDKGTDIDLIMPDLSQFLVWEKALSNLNPSLSYLGKMACALTFYTIIDGAYGDHKKIEAAKNGSKSFGENPFDPNFNIRFAPLVNLFTKNNKQLGSAAYAIFMAIRGVSNILDAGLQPIELSTNYEIYKDYTIPTIGGDGIKKARTNESKDDGVIYTIGSTHQQGPLVVQSVLTSYGDHTAKEGTGHSLLFSSLRNYYGLPLPLYLSSPSTEIKDFWEKP